MKIEQEKYMGIFNHFATKRRTWITQYISFPKTQLGRDEAHNRTLSC